MSEFRRIGADRARNGKYAPLRIKLLWTVLFFVCFMLGRDIPINLLHGAAEGSTGPHSDLLNAANIATGGNFFSPSLFSLGLGPSMTALILWRFLFIAKIARDRRIPEDTMNRARNTLMVVLALFQAISLSARYEIGSVGWGPFSGRVNAHIVVVVILMAGAIVVAWLAHQNEDKGLGGITMFILYQLIVTAARNRDVLDVASGNAEYRRVLVLVVLACVCVALLGVFGGNAELRLHVNKVSIDSGFTGVSYLPIKLNPAGASPVMYVFALLALPQYVVRAVAVMLPSTSGGAHKFLSAWELGRPLGFAAYLMLLFGMTLFFGLFTVGPKDIAKRMEDAGEYFDHIAPGADTRRYLRRRVLALSAVTGVLLVILTGVPLSLIGSYPTLRYLLIAPVTVMIVLGLMWTLQEEVTDTLTGTRYRFTFRATSRESIASPEAAT